MKVRESIKLILVANTPLYNSSKVGSKVGSIWEFYSTGRYSHDAIGEVRDVVSKKTLTICKDFTIRRGAKISNMLMYQFAPAPKLINLLYRKE